MRAAGQDDAGVGRVAVGDGYRLERQAEPLGRHLGLDGGGAHAHLVRGDLDPDVPVAGQCDPRDAAGEAVVGVGGGGAAHAGEPFALAACAGPRIAVGPAEPLGPGAIRLDEVPRGEVLA